MRIDQVGSGNGYQSPQQSVSTASSQSQILATGTEAKVAEKPKVQNTTSENRDIANKEAEYAAELRSKQNEHEVIQAIEKANKHFRTYDRRLEFSIHDTTKQIMVKVINTEDDTVIREIPSEKVLDMVAHMWEVAGILVDEKR